jgi:antitoxin (DNA-binding transcriptional repressor) of toxin-antitoxin stability system
MAEFVSVRQAKAQFSRLVARAGNGEVITITKRGTPIAMLRLLDPRPIARSSGNPGTAVDPMASV